MDSSDFIASLCKVTGDVNTLDLTYGQGVFWKKFTPTRLATNDMYEKAETRQDFVKTDFEDQSFELVVFDPPFTANGPSSKQHQERYHSHRNQAGAPQNINDVHLLLVMGIREACRLSSKWVIVKTQDVVESGKLHSSVNLALNTLVNRNFDIKVELMFNSNRRPQPSGRRVTGLGGRPSVFILARRWR